MGSQRMTGERDHRLKALGITGGRTMNFGYGSVSLSAYSALRGDFM